MATTKITTGGVDYGYCADPLAAAGTTPWYRFGPGTVTAQVGAGLVAANGPTAVTATLQRSGTDPNDATYGAAPAAASATTITGNPSTGGANAVSVVEPGVGWYRLNVTAFTAGSAAGVSVFSGRLAN